MKNPQERKRTMNKVIVIGGGFAGVEAAWQLANRGINVRLFEMKPDSYSPAHTLPFMAELVCSNSLRSNQLENAVGIFDHLAVFQPAIHPVGPIYAGHIGVGSLMAQQIHGAFVLTFSQALAAAAAVAFWQLRAR